MNNNINYYDMFLSNMRSIITVSDELKNYHTVASNNLSILKALYFNLQNDKPINSGITINPTSILPTTPTPTPTPTTPIVNTGSNIASSNIPVALPKNKIINEKKEMITLSDTLKLYNTIEGLINKENFSDYISSYNINMPIIEGITNIDMNNTINIMNDERELLNQLADFNKKYERYIHCNDPKVNMDCISGREPTSTELISKIDNISNIINRMNRNNISQTTNYQTVHNNILNDYDKVVKLRNDLDIKVKLLYDPENSKIVDYKYSYDSTIYSGILISALATSLLYYIFTEL
jgi:hypothetical protein